MLRDDRLQPHRRFNPLTGEWILVSPHRVQRPWQGHKEASPPESRPVYDPDCYLCPGNQRANGDRNPPYAGPFIFDNDFSALLPHGSRFTIKSHPLFKSQNIQGICRVICFSPRHDLSLPEMEQEEILAVIRAWIGQMHELGRRYAWVQIFENKGEMMGCSNPHPHGQSGPAINCLKYRDGSIVNKRRTFGKLNGPCLGITRDRNRKEQSASWLKTKDGWQSCRFGRFGPMKPCSCRAGISYSSPI